MITTMRYLIQHNGLSDAMGDLTCRQVDIKISTNVAVKFIEVFQEFKTLETKTPIFLN